jgi:hypothetical protein
VFDIHQESVTREVVAYPFSIVVNVREPHDVLTFLPEECKVERYVDDLEFELGLLRVGGPFGGH